MKGIARPSRAVSLLVIRDGIVTLRYCFETVENVAEIIALLRDVWPDARFEIGPALH